MLLMEKTKKRIGYKGIKISNPDLDTRPDIRDLIHDEVKKQGKSLNWLAGKIGLTYQHLYLVVAKKKSNLQEDDLDKINIVLNTNF